MKFLIVLILSIFITQFTFAQCKQVLFKGKVYDVEDPSSSYNIMIANRTTGKGVFGNPSGTFSVYVNDGDSITISVKGYDLINLIVQANKQCQFTKNFPIKGKAHEFEELVVRPIKSLEEIRKEREALVLVDTRQVKGIEAFESPITALYQAFSKKEKNKRKVEEWKFQDSKRAVLKEILRTYVAYDVVNLTEAEFDEFINFLNVDPEFLRTASEWELIEFIKRKYDHFISLKYGNGK